MLLNVTLASLISRSSIAGAPVFSQPRLHHIPRLSITGFHVSRQFSSLLFSSGRFSSILISHSHFSHFLDSVVDLTSLSVISGFSDHDTNPAAPHDSFTCTDAVFSSNKTPFNGAAISVSLGSPINGMITNTQLNKNEAGFGGAIFFATPLGNLTITKSWFERNAAGAGSHMYLKCCTFYSNDTRWIVSTGSRSGIQVVDLVSFTLDHANFFRNGHGIIFTSASTTAYIRDSCFLNYNDDANYSENMGIFQGPAVVFFEGTYLNKRPLDGKNMTADEIPSYVWSETPVDTDAAEVCRLVPTPSMTMDVKLNFDAWFSIISIGFFVIVSVLGIIIVTCCHSTPPGKEPLDHSDGVERELEDVHT
jgi:hypothetical protein